MSAHDTADLRLTPNQRSSIILSPEELKVLEECRSEGFNRRGVPCSIALAGCTFLALKTGLLKSHPKYGVLPAVGVAGVIGCIGGVLSYKSICVERVLAVPNGTLRQQLEAMRIQPSRPLDLVPDKFELDVQRPMVSGLQMDIYQSNNNFDGFTGVNSDGDQLSNYDTVKPLPTYSPGIHTYDELRQRNRDEYMQNQSSRQYIPPPRSAAPQGQGYPPTTGPSGPIFEDTRPFDRDRVPQYHLD